MLMSAAVADRSEDQPVELIEATPSELSDREDVRRGARPPSQADSGILDGTQVRGPLSL